MTDYERGYRAGIEAAAKEADKRLAGTSVSEYDAGWMRASFLIATSIRALSQPREPTPSHAGAPRMPKIGERTWDRQEVGENVKRIEAMVEAAGKLIDAAKAPSFPLCPEHAIRLPCPACAGREEP